MRNSEAVVVVPMYNEAPVVGHVVEDLRNHFTRVVCVDDGSADDSAEVARAAGATVLVHRVNLGQGAALQSGFDFVLTRTGARYAVTFDADGQHAVEDAAAMVDRAAARSLDVVLGSRNLGKVDGQPLSRKLLLLAALRLSRASSGLELTDTHNGLRVLSRQALTEIRLSQAGMAYASELEVLVARSSLRWAEHPVTITYTDYSRRKGQRNANAFNIVFDLAEARLRARPC